MKKNKFGVVILRKKQFFGFTPGAKGISEPIK